MSVVKYNFKWPSGPNDVIVTGEFDEWRGTSHMTRSPNSGDFETTLPLKIPEQGHRLYFKFIVDGQWTTSGFYKIGTDTAGNENNFIPKYELRSLAEKMSSGGNRTFTGKKSGIVSRRGSKDGESRRKLTPPSTRSNNHPHAYSQRHRYDHGYEERDGNDIRDRVSAGNGGVYLDPNHDACLGAANAGPIAAAEFLHFFGDDNGSALKKVKIKRKIKRNKKTGERTIVSEEKIPLDDEAFWVRTPEKNISEADGQTGGLNLANAAAGAASNAVRQRQHPYFPSGTHSHPPITPRSSRRPRPVSTTGVPKSSRSSGLLRSGSFTKQRPTSTIGVVEYPNHPKSNAFVGNTSHGVSRKKGSNVSSTSDADEEDFHALPVENLSGDENETFKSLTGELEPFIRNEEEQLGAFDEVSDNVDPKVLNERLNNQYEPEDSKSPGQNIMKNRVIENSKAEEYKEKSNRETGIKATRNKGASKVDTKDALGKLSKDEDLRHLGKDAAQGKVGRDDALKKLGKNSTVKDVGKDLESEATNRRDGTETTGYGGAGTEDSNLETTGTSMRSTRNTGASRTDAKDALGKLSKDEDLRHLGKDVAQGKVGRDDALKKLGKNSTVKDVGKDLGSEATNRRDGTETTGYDGATGTSSNVRAHAGTEDSNLDTTGTSMRSTRNTGASRTDAKDALGKLSKDEDLRHLGKDVAQGKVGRDDALKKLGKNSTVKDVGKDLGSEATNRRDGTETTGYDGATGTSSNVRAHAGTVDSNLDTTGTSMRSTRNTGASRTGAKDALGKLSKDEDLKHLGKDVAQGKVGRDDALKKVGKNSTVKDVGKDLGSEATNRRDGTETTGYGGAGTEDSNLDTTGTSMRSTRNTGASRTGAKDALGKLSKDEDLKHLGKDVAQGKVGRDDTLKKLGKNSTVKDVGKDLGSEATNRRDGTETTGYGGAGTEDSNLDTTGTSMRSTRNTGASRTGAKDALGKLSKDEDLKHLGKDAAQGKVGRDDALKKISNDPTVKDVGNNFASRFVKRGATDSSGTVGLERKGHNARSGVKGDSRNRFQSSSHDETISNDVIEAKRRRGADSKNISTNNEDVNLGGRHRDSYVTAEKADINGKADPFKSGMGPQNGVKTSGGLPKQSFSRELTSNELQEEVVKESESRTRQEIRPTLDPKAGSHGYDSSVNGRNPSRHYRDVRTDGDRENEPYLDPLNSSSLGSRHVQKGNTGPFTSSASDVRIGRSANRNAAGTANEKDDVKAGTTSRTRVRGSSAVRNASNTTIGKDTFNADRGNTPSGGIAPTTTVETGKVISSPSRDSVSSNGQPTKGNRHSLSIPFVRSNKSVNSKGTRPSSISGAVNSEGKISRPRRDIGGSKEVNAKGLDGDPTGAAPMAPGGTDIEQEENFLKPAGAETDVNGSKLSKGETSNFVGMSGSGMQDEKTRMEPTKGTLKQDSGGAPNEPTSSTSKETVALESRAGANAASRDSPSPQSAAQSAATSAVNNAEKKRRFSIWAKVKRALL